MAIDSIKLTPYAFYDVMRQYAFRVVSDTPTFERTNHPAGYLLYERYLRKAEHIKLYSKGINDYALIYIGDSLVATIDRNAPVGSLPKRIPLDIPMGKALRILVENMGHVNFGKKLWDDQKGFTNGIVLNGARDFQVGITWLDSMPEYSGSASYHLHQPVYYKGTFELKGSADTYLDMHGFGKGVVFINGHNLGRYWEVGPQFSLYVPGVWLNKGKNEIVIFDQLNHKQMHSISSTAKPVNR
jgi:beta-galactosidase